jgi:hypothetical protein
MLASVGSILVSRQGFLAMFRQRFFFRKLRWQRFLVGDTRSLLRVPRPQRSQQAHPRGWAISDYRVAAGMRETIGGRIAGCKWVAFSLRWMARYLGA